MKKRILVLPTAAMLALIGCTSHSQDSDYSDDQQVRNTYDSANDCKKDNQETACERVVVHDRVYYYGPWMPYHIWYGYGPSYFHSTTVINSSAPSAAPVSRTAAVEAHSVSISRGGFGSTARGGSSGGE